MRTKLKRNERGFRTELQRGAADRGFHVVKIPDNPGKFKVKAIYDLGLLRCGTYHAIELKEVVAPAWALVVPEVEDHQIENLQDATNAGGIGWIVCNFRLVPGPARQAEFGKKPIREAWAVLLRQFLAAKEQEHRSSLSLEWFRAHGIALNRYKVETTTKDGKPIAYTAWDFWPAHAAALNGRSTNEPTRSRP